MEPKGLDMGDYQERYQDYDIEVAVEQVLTGVKAHFRVLRDDAVVVDWRLVHIDTPVVHRACRGSRRASRRRAKRSMPASPHSHKHVSRQAHSIKLAIFRLAGDRCAPVTRHSDHPYLF